jgi:hypothetical protein
MGKADAIKAMKSEMSGPTSLCNFCGQEHPPKRICKERLRAIEEMRRGKPTKQKGRWQ